MLYYPQAALLGGGFGSLVSEFADGDTRELFLWDLQNFIIFCFSETMGASVAFIMAFIVSVNVDSLAIRANDINMK